MSHYYEDEIVSDWESCTDEEREIPDEDFSQYYSVGTDLSPVDAMGFPIEKLSTPNNSKKRSKLEQRIGQDVEVVVERTTTAKRPSHRRFSNTIHSTNTLPRKARSLDSAGKALVSNTAVQSGERRRASMRRANSEAYSMESRALRRRASISNTFEERRSRPQRGGRRTPEVADKGRVRGRRQSIKCGSNDDGPMDRAQKMKELALAFQAAKFLETTITPKVDHLKKDILM